MCLYYSYAQAGKHTHIYILSVDRLYMYLDYTYTQAGKHIYGKKRKEFYLI